MAVRANIIASPASSARRSVEAARRRTQAERSEETRTRILKAAANLIRKRGYARFRTAEVAKEAGLSRGAQLHHFPTKDSLVVATLEHVFEQAQVLSRRRASAVNRPRDLIEAVIEDAREFFFSEHFMVAIDIVLSTSTINEDILESYRLSCSSYVVKPIEFNQFVTTVQSIVDYWFAVAVLPDQRTPPGLRIKDWALRSGHSAT